MPTTRRRLALASGFVLAVPALVAGTTVFAQSADAAAVDKAISELRDAMLTADRAKLTALLSDQLSYGHSAGRLETKTQFLDVVAGKKTLYKSIVFSDATTSVAGNNAIVRHVMTVETESDGKPATAKVGALQVWVKDGSAWKLLARQAFRL